MVTVNPVGATPASVLPSWMANQTLKSVATPGYEPSGHQEALSVIGARLLNDRSIASGKLSDTLQSLISDPLTNRASLTEVIFGGNSGYAMHLVWPIAAIFAGRMPRRISKSTADGYIGWVNRIGRVAARGLEGNHATEVHAVIDAVIEAFSGAVGANSADSADVARGAEDASDRVNTSEPGIYVFTTPTYLAYPPLGWNTDEVARQDFRYLKTGSTTVDVTGRIQTEIRRQTGLPEPYVILAKFTATEGTVDYVAVERILHRILGEARHGPEEDGTRRSSARGAGTEWFITRLPFVITVAESLGLCLKMSDELKGSLNEMFEDCDLSNWVFA